MCVSVEEIMNKLCNADVSEHPLHKELFNYALGNMVSVVCNCIRISCRLLTTRVLLQLVLSLQSDSKSTAPVVQTKLNAM